LSYVRIKRIKGHDYYYRVRSVREGKRVRQLFEAYIGPVSPAGGGAPGAEVEHAAMTKVRVRFPRTKEYRGRTLNYRKTLNDGKTALYVEPGVPDAEVRDLEDAFERLPVSMRNDVKEISVVKGEGDPFTVGTTSYKEGGNFHTHTGALHVFTESGDRRWVKDFRSADFIMVHEVGHGTYERYERARTDVRTKARESFDYDKSLERNKAIRQREIDALDAKWKPRLDKANERLEQEDRLYRRNLDERMETPSGRKLDQLEAERNLIAKDRAVARGQATKLGKAYRKERDAIPGTFERTDKEFYEARAKADDEWEAADPANKAWSEFHEASDREGPVSPYVKSYFDASSGQRYTEQFADSTRIWYSESEPKAEARRLADTHPDTYKAWRTVMDKEAHGHAVPLTRRPRPRPSPG